MSAGAAYANWNVKTKMLEMSYNPSISNPVKIETAIANAGYDTQDVKASNNAYNKLDECCQYDRKSITSKKIKMKNIIFICLLLFGSYRKCAGKRSFHTGKRAHLQYVQQGYLQGINVG